MRFHSESSENDDGNDNNEENVSSLSSHEAESDSDISSKNLNNSLESTTIIDDLMVKINESSFLCLLCEKTFVHQRNCRRHVKALHFQEKEKKNAQNNLQQYKEKNVNNSKNDINFENLIYSKPTAWLLVKCNLCNVSFTNCKELRQHLVNHSEIDTLHSLKLSDDNIQILFPNATSLETVKLTIIKDVLKKQWFKYYTVLNKYFYEMSISDTEVEDLEEEENKGRDSKYKCAFCNLEFSFKFQVFQHLKEGHSGKRELPFSCERCELKFVSIKMYRQHLQTHCRNEHKSLLCGRCPGKFVWPENIKHHFCAALKPEIKNCPDNYQDTSYIFRCCLCSQNFPKLLYLRTHLLLHADGKTGIDYQNCFYIKEFKSPETINNILIQQQIQSAFRRSQISRFYQAADKYGNEIDISDSESDCDTEESNMKYACEICCKNFKRRKHLLEHQKQWHKGLRLPHTCEVCKRQFVSPHLLRQHLKKVCYNESRRTAPQCEICNTRFIWPNNMLKHKETQHHITSKPKLTISSTMNDDGDIPVEMFFITNTAISSHQNLPNSKQYSPQVNDAESETTSKSNSNPRDGEQIKQNLVNKYECQICKVSFSNKENLITHTIKKHKLNNFQCSFCKEAFTNATDLQTHKETVHAERKHFACLFCDKTFSHQKALNIHINVHMQAGHYKCTTCQKSFKHAYHLKAHFLTHSGNTSNTNNSKGPSTSTAALKVVCPICGTSLSNNPNLKQHLKIHSGEKPYKCEHCDASFLRRYYLKLHTRVHTKEKPYQCSYCEKSFATQQRLRNHIRIHTGERPYLCKYCKKTFNNSSRLNLHIRIHTGKKPFKCEICGKTFICGAYLKRHRIAKGHNIKET